MRARIRRGRDRARSARVLSRNAATSTFGSARKVLPCSLDLVARPRARPRFPPRPAWPRPDLMPNARRPAAATSLSYRGPKPENTSVLPAAGGASVAMANRRAACAGLPRRACLRRDAHDQRDGEPSAAGPANCSCRIGKGECRRGCKRQIYGAALRPAQGEQLELGAARPAAASGKISPVRGWRTTHIVGRAIRLPTSSSAVARPVLAVAVTSCLLMSE